MTKSFVDTTIVVDYIFKRGSPLFDQAKRALENYDTNEVPTYALKELCAGVLQNYIWFHNKLVTTGSFAAAVGALSSLRARPGMVGTINEAIGMAGKVFESASAKELLSEYNLTVGQFLSDEIRLWFERQILRALKHSTKKPFTIVEPLPCFPREMAVRKENNVYQSAPKCFGTCCLPAQFSMSKKALQALIGASGSVTKKEMQRRGAVLQAIKRAPTKSLSKTDCRALGDAVFALQCPETSDLLTTNLADHELLAKAIGKKAVRPV